MYLEIVSLNLRETSHLQILIPKQLHINYDGTNVDQPKYVFIPILILY